MSKVLNVFYGADRLPYKDQERQVHYPMVGNSFAGASLVDEIRFYAKDLGTENNVFVGIAKRPDGQRGYQVLTYGYDTELNEPYWTFNVSGWFTEKVGNVFVSLNVYQGGVDIEVDEDSGLAIVSGTPIIQATGSVVLSINYAPVMDNGYGAVPTIDVQEALSLVGSKVDTDYLTANYYNKTTIDGKLLLKADLSYVNDFVKTLEVSMDSSTYVLTFTCKDGTGTTISTQSIDLPLESVVVSGEYDSDTQSIILTLQNGNTISIPVSDLVDGLVDTTTFETAIQGIEDELDTKANANEVYTKDEVDTLLSAKADKTTTTSLQNQINDLNSRLVVVEEAIIGVDTLTFTALSYSAIPNVSDNLYPLIQSGGLDTKEVKGNSFVHSQLVPNTSIFSTSGLLTVSYNTTTKQYTFTTSSTNWEIPSFIGLTSINGHKYLVKPNIVSKTENANIRLRYPVVVNPLANAVISPTNDLTFFAPQLQSTDGSEASATFSLNYFDLTKDFGVGNEPTTYDQAVSMYASKGIDITNYVAYTQGTLIDSKPVKLVSRGFNIWDEEWELGTYAVDTGLPVASSTNIRSKSTSYIKVMPNKTYCFFRSGFAGNIIEYDENDNFIQTFPTQSNYTFTTSSKAHHIRFYMGNAYGTTYNHDICVNLSSTLNGTYKPYKAPIEYPITTEVLRSAGSVQDSATSKKVGFVNLGSLDWAAGSFTNTHCFQASGFSGFKTFGSNEKANIVCAKYTTDTSNVVYAGTTDKTISISSVLRINDSAYDNTTDLVTFKTAMSGVILNYELATPTEQTATLPTDIEIEKGGSLEVVYDNGYTTPADFVFDCAVYKPLE